MAAAPLPADEALRLRSLRACELLDTPPDPRFDAFTRLASQIYGVPFALVSLVDSDREWFKSAVGLPQGIGLPRDVAFCAHAILRPMEPMLVPDARLDPRFAENPAVIGPPGIRFYAGVPLLDRAGLALGSLCILDTVPHAMDEAALAPLRDLASGVATLLEHGRSLAELHEAAENHHYATELSPQIPWTASPEGQILTVSLRWCTLTGLRLEETLGDGWVRALHPDDVVPTLRSWGEALRSGMPIDLEYRMSYANGGYGWFRVRASARRDAAGRVLRWYGTLEDINDRKLIGEALRKSDELARSILESSPLCIKVLDLAGSLIFMNGPGLRQFDVGDFAVLEGWGWRQQLAPGYVGQVLQAAREASRGTTSRFLVRTPTLSGVLRDWDVSVGPIAGPDGAPYRLLWISREVTEERRAREQQELAAARLAEVLETTTDCVAVLDRDWNFTYLNGQAERWFAGRGPALGASAWSVLAGEADRHLARQLREAAAKPAPSTFEAYLPSLQAWLEVHAYPSDGLTLFFRDISERKRSEAEKRRAERRIAHMARHDGLTGLANRGFFQDQVALALREGAGDCAVFFLDLDNFKDVNDGLGHTGGDQLLRQVGERLQNAGCDAACVARLGGDEFGLVLRRPGPMPLIAALAARVIAAVVRPYTIDGQRVRIGASIGIACATAAPADEALRTPMLQAPALDAELLLKQADTALHVAKAEGPGLYRFYTAEMDVRQQSRRALRGALRDALEAGEFHLTFQPVIDLANGRVVACEALLRWHRPGIGAVSPAEFIPVAEETGLIVPLGAWVLQQACQAALDWPAGIGVAVNLSPAQFTGPALVQTIADALQESGLAPERLELEITESVLLHEDAAALAALHALRDLGIRIAMDDFGTGYSSLGYLRRFPFDKIKVDRSFIADLPARAGSLAILRAIIGLGRSFGMPITAEGVETPEQAALVRAEGCRFAQGYLYSRPLPGTEIRRFLLESEQVSLAGG